MKRWFRSRCRPARGDFFREQTRAFLRARELVKFCYLALLFLSISSLPDWSEMLGRKMVAPLWPVAWLQFVNESAGIVAILVLHLAGALLGAIFPGQRWARALAFLGLLEFVAFNNSFGKIGHSMHLWVLTAFGLVFLPRVEPGETSRVLRQRFLLIFWGCQAIVLLAYSMSGLGKLLGGFHQIFLGQTHIFLPDAFSRIVAERLQETNSTSLLGPWLIAHPLAGWPMMLADLYLQTFSFWAAFRPALHRFWAIGLILFHIASYLFLSINFATTAFLVAILFLRSPFQRAHDGWRQALSDLPIFGILLRRCVF
jgi:hypothetical protein